MQAQIQDTIQSIDRLLENTNYPQRRKVVEHCVELMNSTNAFQLQLKKSVGDDFPFILVLSGVVPFTYNRQCFHAPVHIHIPQYYPIEAPQCFVKPAQGMAIPRNHPKVNSETGVCSTDIINNWDGQQSTLLHVFSSLSHVFSLNTPVYEVSPSNTLSTTTPTSTTSVASLNASPFNSNLSSTSTLSELSSTSTTSLNLDQKIKNLNIKTKKDDNNNSNNSHNESEILIKTSEADRLCELISRKGHEGLQSLADNISVALTIQNEVESRVDFIFDSFLRLKKEKELLMRENVKLENGIKSVSQWFGDNEKYIALTEKPDIDQVVQYADKRTEQIIELIAVDKSLSEIMFSLDDALQNHIIDMETWLKATRVVSKDQYMTRARLQKIKSLHETVESRKSFSHK